MGALSPEELEVALAARADVVAWREAFVGAAAAPGARVHVKLDTGMGRLGTRDAEEATRVAEAVAARGDLRLAGAMTHFATADDDPAFVAEQLAAFTPWAEALKAAHPDAARPRRQLGRHAARARRALRPRALRDRGLRHGPVPRGPGRARARARAVAASPTSPRPRPPRRARARATAGASWPSAPTCVGTLPIGYGDGVRRALTNNADVLVGRPPRAADRHGLDGQRHRRPRRRRRAAVGEEAVLIGRQGGERILAEEVARRLGTINYEVTCGISARVPRVYGRMSDAARGRARGRSAASRPGSSAARSATACSGARRPTSTSRWRATPEAAARAIARAARRHGVRALGRVRRLARGRRAATPGTSTSCGCATTTSTPTSPPATSPSTRWPSRWPAASCVDPHGGRADLEARRLRMVCAAALADDPLRTLRAARLATELELDGRARRPPRRCARRAPELARRRRRARVRRAQADRGRRRGRSRGSS